MLATALLSSPGSEFLKPHDDSNADSKRNFWHHVEKYTWFKENRLILTFPTHGLEISKSLQDIPFSSFIQNSNSPFFPILHLCSLLISLNILLSRVSLVPFPFFSLWPVISKLLFINLRFHASMTLAKKSLCALP